MLLVACAKSETKAADTTAVASTTSTSMGAVDATPMAEPITFAKVAGDWNVRSVPTSGSDTSATELTLHATDNATGWTQTYKNGLKVPVQVSIAGDSIVHTAGPYTSVRRKNTRVTTNGVFRLHGDSLVGTTVAHYATKGADSVLTLRLTGTRKP
jgi:hypothetical protein